MRFLGTPGPRAVWTFGSSIAYFFSQTPLFYFKINYFILVCLTQKLHNIIVPPFLKSLVYFLN